MSKEIVFFDGQLMPADQATLPVLSRAVLYGEGLFETFRTYQQQPFGLPDHILRMQKSAKALGLTMPGSLYKIENIIPDLLWKNKLNEAIIRISLLASTSPGGFTAKAQKSHLLLIARPIPDAIKRDQDQGVSAVSRPAGSAPLAEHKMTSYMRSVTTARAVPPNQAREVLFLDDQGNLSEGATSNIFAIVRDALVTPSADGRILPGVTRKFILNLAKDNGLPLKEHPITPKILKLADGLFISNSVIELLPVVSLDQKPIGKGKPHQITRMILDLYHEKIDQELGQQAE